MKTAIIIAGICLISSAGFAQKKESLKVPAAVKESFAEKFPGAKVEEWEKEGADYEVEFTQNKVESSAVFDANGKFKESESEIKISALPKGVTEYCTKNYAGYKLSEASKIMDASGKTTYEAEMKKGKVKFDAIFDSNGIFIKKLEKKSTEEEKED